MRRCDPDTVDLLWAFVHSEQPANYTPDDLSTWRVHGWPLTAAQRHRLRSSSQEDFDALDLLLATEGALLTAGRWE